MLTIQAFGCSVISALVKHLFFIQAQSELRVLSTENHTLSCVNFLQGVKVKKIIAATLLASLAGCSYVPADYSPSAYNVQTIQSLNMQTASFAGFDSESITTKSMMCRAAGPIAAPDDLTYSQYISGAFESEMELAGVSEDGLPTISGSLNSISFGSMGTGKWNFQVTMKSSNGESFVQESAFEFKSAYSADKACQRVAQNLSPAVEKLISDTMNNPEFAKLLK